MIGIRLCACWWLVVQLKVFLCKQRASRLHLHVCIPHSHKKYTLWAKVGHKCNAGCLACKASSISWQCNTHPHTHAHLRNKSEDRGAERENRVKIVASGRSRWGEGRNGRRRLTRPPGEREEWLSKHRLHMNSVIGGTGRVFAYLRIH